MQLLYMFDAFGSCIVSQGIVFFVMVLTSSAFIALGKCGDVPTLAGDLDHWLSE